MKMMLVLSLVLLFLWSGFLHLTYTSQRLRLFSLPNITELNQTDSVHECNKTNESLVTLYDDEDHEFIKNYTSEGEGSGFWLGLRKRHIITWLDGTPSNLTEQEEMCQAIDNGTWNVSNCSDKKYFMCYNGSTNLFKSKKTWCQALKHCKDNSSELVSIRSKAQNETVIKEGRNTSFWIGLMLDGWEWEDKGCSTFRKWYSQPTENSFCAGQIAPFPLISPLECISQESPICSKGTVRIKVIEQPKPWEDAFKYCKEHHTRLLWIRDESDQKAVKQWLDFTNVTGPFWIGLRQSRIFGFWLWSSDTTVGQWNNWKDERIPELPLSNHCGVIKRDNYTWSDEDCKVPLSFLCEEDIIFHVK